MLHWRALENTHAEIDETENSVATFGLPGKFPLTRVSGALTDGSIIAFSRRSASLDLAFRVFRQRRSSFFDSDPLSSDELGGRPQALHSTLTDNEAIRFIPQQLRRDRDRGTEYSPGARLSTPNRPAECASGHHHRWGGAAPRDPTVATEPIRTAGCDRHRLDQGRR